MAVTARIAILADVHVPDYPRSAQRAALDWALGYLAADPVDVLAVAGDVTAVGSVESARTVRATLDGSGVAYRMTPGNSDRRTPDDWPATRSLLTVADPFISGGLCVVMLETSADTIDADEQRRCEASIAAAGEPDVVLVTHMKPAALSGASRAWLESILSGGGISLFVAGHHHVDDRWMMGQTPVHLVRGLDPDKAIGGPPSLSIFERSASGWSRRDVPFPGGLVNDWSDSERAEFMECLGVSCMDGTLAGLDKAAQRAVRCVEIRAGDALTVPDDALTDGLQRWRGGGGRYLSIHMPDLRWDADAGQVVGLDAWQAAVSLAVRHGVEAMTIHVPRASVAAMQAEGQAWRRMGETLCETLGEAMAAGVVLSIENLHLSRGQASDDSRQFGCLPNECLAWVHYVRQVTGYDRVGVHLDIGHARNNPPFSKRLCVGHWYVLAGAAISGYHLHQVVSIEGVGMKNHFPIDSVYGPLISLSSFFWGWRLGPLRHAPMFLEIRGADAVWPCLDRLRQHVAG